MTVVINKSIFSNFLVHWRLLNFLACWLLEVIQKDFTFFVVPFSCLSMCRFSCSSFTPDLLGFSTSVTHDLPTKNWKVAHDLPGPNAVKTKQPFSVVFTESEFWNSWDWNARFSTHGYLFPNLLACWKHSHRLYVLGVLFFLRFSAHGSTGIKFVFREKKWNQDTTLREKFIVFFFAYVVIGPEFTFYFSLYLKIRSRFACLH